MTAEEKRIEDFKNCWYKRNPVHETNLDTGEDMFWKTAMMVADDYSAEKDKEIAELRKENDELRDEVGELSARSNGWKDMVDFKEKALGDTILNLNTELTALRESNGKLVEIVGKCNRIFQSEINVIPSWGDRKKVIQEIDQALTKAEALTKKI